MGRALAEHEPVARRTFEEADDVLGFRLSQLCFEGPDEQLQKTEITQPALLAVSVAGWRVLKNAGYTPNFVAGHSLGEYSALVAAGSLAFADALRLVRNRGKYMQEAVPLGVGTMAAILKLPAGKLESVLAEAAQGEVVDAANLNSPDQVVIAGHVGAVERAMNLAKAAGAKRVVALHVSAPFHCLLMKPAQERLKMDLDQTSFSDLQMPLVNNWKGEPVSLAGEAREGLYEQVPNPVRWADAIRTIRSLSADRFIEVGPGSVLSGLCRQIDASFQGAKFGEPADLEKVRDVLA